MLAQSDIGSPAHINSMATAVGVMLTYFPRDSLRRGDVLFTNDPRISSGHKNDVLLLTPVFADEVLIAFAGVIAHTIDIGGIPRSAAAVDAFEDGVLIPPTKLFDAGTRADAVVRLILANVRAPDLFLGDLQALVAANAVAVRRLLETLEEFGQPDLHEVSDEIIARSTEAVRRSLGKLRQGEYFGEAPLDGVDEPLVIKVKLTIGDERVGVDFSGTSPQTRSGFNSVLNYTTAYAAWAVKAALFPEIPNNAGSLSLVDVAAPRGSILNATETAAVAARQLVMPFLTEAIFSALWQAGERHVLAPGTSLPWSLGFQGVDREGNNVSAYWFLAAGNGARPGKDGWSNLCFPSRVKGIPVEQIEGRSPVLFHSRRVAADTGGPGEFRGGCGQEVEFSFDSGARLEFFPLFERMHHAAQGWSGGREGCVGVAELSDGTALDGKRRQLLPPGARLRIRTPGGGGLGSPSKRPREAVAADVAEGLVSPDGALRDYGFNVQLDPSPSDAPPGQPVTRQHSTGQANGVPYQK